MLSVNDCASVPPGKFRLLTLRRRAGVPGVLVGIAVAVAVGSGVLVGRGVAVGSGVLVG